MREIKFRAWDKKNKQMKVVTELDFSFFTKQPLTYEAQGMNTDVWLNHDSQSFIPVDVELLQFTGFKDRDNKEIYEGDILRYDDCGYILDHVVQWSKKDAMFIFKDIDDSYGAADMNFNNCLIVGNIYENPELLMNNELIQGGDNS